MKTPPLAPIASPALAVQIYTPEPALKHPLTMAREMAAGVWSGRDLAWRLFLRDLSAQYRQTFLGYVWAFLPPLAASATFIFLNAQGIVQIDTGGVPYAAFAMMGTLLWQVFADAVQMPAAALIQAKPMLSKIKFPYEAILMAGGYMVGFNFLVRLVLLAGVMAWWKVVPGSGLVLFIPAIFALILCGTAFGMLLAPIGGLYGDITKGIPIALQFWMLLTPVVYPAREHGLAAALTQWNPVSPLLVTARQTLTSQPLTLLPEFVIVTALSALVLLAGWIGFRTAMPHVVARMGG